MSTESNDKITSAAIDPELIERSRRLLAEMEENVRELRAAIERIEQHQLEQKQSAASTPIVNRSKPAEGS